MWIRSQDRTDLLEVNEISIIETIDNGYPILSGGLEIGRYSTKEKALKVMDMIQEYIELSNNIGKKEFDVYCSCGRKNKVIYEYNEMFQMPRDYEVK